MSSGAQETSQVGDITCRNQTQLLEVVEGCCLRAQDIGKPRPPGGRTAALGELASAFSNPLSFLRQGLLDSFIYP